MFVTCFLLSDQGLLLYHLATTSWCSGKAEAEQAVLNPWSSQPAPEVTNPWVGTVPACWSGSKTLHGHPPGWLWSLLLLDTHNDPQNNISLCFLTRWSLSLRHQPGVKQGIIHNFWKIRMKIYCNTISKGSGKRFLPLSLEFKPHGRCTLSVLRFSQLFSPLSVEWPKIEDESGEQNHNPLK